MGGKMDPMTRLFEHMEWADRRLVALFTATPAARDAPGALRWLAHIVAAERVWLRRIRGEDWTTTPIWPEWTVEEIAEIAAGNARGYPAVAGEDGARVVEYRTSEGKAFQTRLDDILTHVALHGSYHRGQIAAALRAAGVAPVGTDFILFAREITR